MLNAATPHRKQVWTDLLGVAGITVLAAIASIQFDIAERVLAWMHLQEDYELDELPGVLLVFACGMLWFSRRRYDDMRVEISRRQQVESRLADLLEQNRRMAQHLVSVQEAERRSLARELHDELGQYMNAVKVDAITLRQRCDVGMPQERNLLNGIIGNIDYAYHVVNDMIRRLRPVGLDTLGVVAAIEHCVNGWRSRLPEVRFQLVVDGDFTDLDEARSLTLYRITQESLTMSANMPPPRWWTSRCGGSAMVTVQMKSRCASPMTASALWMINNPKRHSGDWA